MADQYDPPRAGEIFLEPPDLDGALGLALRVDRVLEARHTGLQDLVVAECGPLGRVLILDGAIQAAEFDESGYHEMLAHVPLLTHPDPRRVLIIGGGDGGTLREVLRHPEVEHAELCEIDAGVIEACRRHLPSLAGSFDDPRAQVHIADGIEFVRRARNAYDVIIVDSSDPEGPAVPLFGADFYREVRTALRPGGLVASQMESHFLYPQLISKIVGVLEETFPLARYYQTCVPSYLSGVIGFSLASLGPDPLAGPDPERAASLGRMAYYSPLVHRAAFVLPPRALALLPPAAAAAQGGRA